MRIPLTFPKIYRGQFALIDDDAEPLTSRYTWGIRVRPDGTEHVIGRQAGDRKERSLASVAAKADGFQFTHINGDPLDCTVPNLRCMNPARYLKYKGHEWPGETSKDAGYQLARENQRVSGGTVRTRRKRLGFGERPEFA